MDIREYNRSAWDREVEKGNPWTIPVSHEEIASARLGQWKLFLTPTRPVPRTWLPDVKGRDVLCLASGGGQQGPILAAAGATVTVLDNSPKQLERDRMVAQRESLDLTTVVGDMADLSMFASESFDLIFHPVSNCFAQAVRPVWKEAFRVLRPGGVLVAGFNNPAFYLFDWKLMEQGTLKVAHSLPYSDLESLSEEEKQRHIAEGEPLEFSHSLEDQIGGQADAGFWITGLYEDNDGEENPTLLNQYMRPYIATRATKPPENLRR